MPLSPDEMDAALRAWIDDQPDPRQASARLLGTVSAMARRYAPAAEVSALLYALADHTATVGGKGAGGA